MYPLVYAEEIRGELERVQGGRRKIMMLVGRKSDFRKAHDRAGCVSALRDRMQLPCVRVERD